MTHPVKPPQWTPELKDPRGWIILGTALLSVPSLVLAAHLEADAHPVWAAVAGIPASITLVGAVIASFMNPNGGWPE